MRLKRHESGENGKNKVIEEAGENNYKAQMGVSLKFGKCDYFLSPP